jgi:integrase
MRGSIEKRGEQVYRLRVHLGYAPDGRRSFRTETVHGTKREAEKRLNEILQEVQATPVQELKTHTEVQTVGQFLDHWLTTYARRKSPRTFENYTEYVENYIKPHLGALPLTELATKQVQEFLDRLSLTRRRNSVGILSPTTVNNCHRVLKGALQRAVLWKLIPLNPAMGAYPPRVEEREPRVLNPEQIALLLASAERTRLKVPVLLGLATGMRRGEICGLRWSDVRFDRAAISVRQTLVRVAPGQLEFKPPKTRSGRRSIQLPKLLVEALRKELEKQTEARSVLGKSYNAHDLVVCREDGRPVDPATLYSNFQKLLEKAGLPRMAIHDLRHSHATLLLEEGQHIKVVAERLGHADPGVTMRVYSHVMAHMQQGAADSTESVLRSAISKHDGQA